MACRPRCRHCVLRAAADKSAHVQLGLFVTFSTTAALVLDGIAINRVVADHVLSIDIELDW
jgi:hypothetical protein